MAQCLTCPDSEIYKYLTWVVPNKLIKVRIQKFSLVPIVKQVEGDCKKAFFSWKSAGTHGPKHPLSIQRKQAKFNVRRQIER